MAGAVSGQTSLEMPPVVTYTDARGVLEFSIADLKDFDPERRITLAALVQTLGSSLGPLRTIRQPESDPVLNLQRPDFKEATRQEVENGLYIDEDDPRYPNGDQIIKTDFRRGRRLASQLGLKLLFPLDSHPAVVFPAEEYPAVARSHNDLIRAVKAKTRRANQGNPDPKEVTATVNRTAAHVSQRYKERLVSLESQYVEDTKVIVSLGKQAKPEARARYKAKNLDRKRKHAHDLIHHVIDTAAVNNGWDARTGTRFHKVFDSRMYRDESDPRTNHSWRVGLLMLYYYTNARRLMVVQSLAACGSQYSLYRQALPEAA